MMHSPVGLYCCICGIKFFLNSTPGVYQRCAFGGPCCSKGCYAHSQIKYARMILNQNVEDDT